MTAVFSKFLPLLAQARVRFILVGGGAAIAHGSARTTYDADIVYARDTENLQAIVQAIGSLKPYLRGAPPGLPFVFSVETLKQGFNFTLTTAEGDIDLLGEVAGGGTYDSLLPFSDTTTAFGVQCQIISLPKLIDLKRAAGRPKDLEAIAELEAILEEQQSS
jgi:hypothetical protein